MGITLLLGGFALFVAGLVLIVTNPSGPKSGDIRIIKTADGHFQLQRYFQFANWHPIPRSEKDFATLQEAQQEKSYYETPRETVVESQ